MADIAAPQAQRRILIQSAAETQARQAPAQQAAEEYLCRVCEKVVLDQYIGANERGIFRRFVEFLAKKLGLADQQMDAEMVRALAQVGAQVLNRSHVEASRAREKDAQAARKAQEERPEAKTPEPVGEASSAKARAENVDVNSSAFKALEAIAEGGASGVVRNAVYGDILYPLGRLGKKGGGFLHIVEQRMKKDGATLNEAIDIALAVGDAAEKGKETNGRANTRHFELNGVRAIVAFNEDGNKIITGYEISADATADTVRRSTALQSQTHVRLEAIVAALKDRLAELREKRNTKALEPRAEEPPARAERAGSAAKPNYWEASTPEENGETVSGVWRVIDARDLVASTDEGYDDTLQPRNRERRASTVQVAKIATALKPERLDASQTSDLGAPIVDGRGQVLSGNGRTLAVRAAYDAGGERAEAYRAHVLARAKEMGVEVPEGVREPVLVREVRELGGMTLQEFAQRSNKSQVARMSEAEQAVSDARIINDKRLIELFFPSDTGDVLAASNQEFIGEFLAQVGGREEYIDAKGRVNAALAKRIKRAVLVAMLAPERRETAETLLESEGWSALVNGLMNAAARLGRLRGNAEYDLAPEINEAVDLYISLRREGRTLEEHLSQGEMFNKPPSEAVIKLAELFEENRTTSTGISDVLNRFCDKALKIDTTTDDMFGVPNPTKAELLESAKRAHIEEAEAPKLADKGETFNRAIEDAIDNAEAKYSERESEADKKLKAEHDKQRKEAGDFVNRNEDFTPDGLVSYTPLSITEGEFGDNYVPAIVEKDGKFRIEYADEINMSGETFDSLKDAQLALFDAEWEVLHPDKSGEYNIAETREKFMSALKEIGYEVGRRDWSIASTGSEYLTVYDEAGNDIKIRIADHAPTHRFDVWIENDWKAAFRWVAERLENGDIDTFRRGLNGAGVIYADNGETFRRMQELSKEIGKPFDEVFKKIPYAVSTLPAEIIYLKSEKEKYVADAERFLKENKSVRAVDNTEIRLDYWDYDKRGERSLRARALHLITEKDRNTIDEKKLRWVKKIPETLRYAQAKFSNEHGKNKKIYYVRNYEGNIHIVITSARGKFRAHLITQYPVEQKQPHAFLRGAVLNAIYTADGALHTNPNEQGKGPRESQRGSSLPSRFGTSLEDAWDARQQKNADKGDTFRPMDTERAGSGGLDVDLKLNSPITIAALNYAKHAMMRMRKGSGSVEDAPPDWLQDKHLPLKDEKGRGYTETQRTAAVHMARRIVGKIVAMRREFASELEGDKALEQAAAEVRYEEVISRAMNASEDYAELWGRAIERAHARAAKREEAERKAQAEKTKGLKPEDFEENPVEAILQALEAEPARPKREATEEAEAELPDVAGEGDGGAETPAAFCPPFGAAYPRRLGVFIEKNTTSYPQILNTQVIFVKHITNLKTSNFSKKTPYSPSPFGQAVLARKKCKLTHFFENLKKFVFFLIFCVPSREKGVSFKYCFLWQVCPPHAIYSGLRWTFASQAPTLPLIPLPQKTVFQRFRLPWHPLLQKPPPKRRRKQAASSP